jgi:hypothetical protein
VNVQNAQRQAEQARKAQVAAWARWNKSDSAEDMAAWDASVVAMRKAEDVVDRAEVWADANEDRQADWWDAAVSNGRA